MEKECEDIWVQTVVWETSVVGAEGDAGVVG